MYETRRTTDRINNVITYICDRYDHCPALCDTQINRVRIKNWLEMNVSRRDISTAYETVEKQGSLISCPIVSINQQLLKQLRVKNTPSH